MVKVLEQGEGYNYKSYESALNLLQFKINIGEIKYFRGFFPVCIFKETDGQHIFQFSYDVD